jgi:two-component system sensor histidine kinase KdpD
MMPRTDENQATGKKSPEDWLEKASEEEAGSLKVFLGYAPGVGKTFNMLSEARRRRSRGEDIVIGVIETHGRAGCIDLIEGVEVVPLCQVEYKGTVFQEMDVDAILRRRPAVVLVDELAHTNIAGSKHAKRYEDVLELLDAKISVISAINVQHLESISPTVQSITGIVVRETVPDWVLRRADEVVLVDLSPESLQTRMLRGDIYPQERVERALANFFRKGNLLALRELALKQVTSTVDRHLDAYMRRKRIGENWAVQERVAVCISENTSAHQLMARGALMADALGAELYVVHVEHPAGLSEEEQRSLAANFRFAENLNGRPVRLPGRDVASTVAEFVRQQRITQILFGRHAVSGVKKYLYYSAIQRFLEKAPHVDVHIVTQDPE